MTLDPLGIRQRLGRKMWSPAHPMGPDGWAYRHTNGVSSVIVTSAPHGEPVTDWVHASVAHADRMPEYDDLKMLHRAVFGDGWAYQVFAPPSEHINIHQFALHLFGRLDGRPVLPDFTDGTGSI
jgi:hypothetical protein